MNAVPSMPVEEHQVLDPRILRQAVDQIELGDSRSGPAPLLGVEFANPHESSSARLLSWDGDAFRNGHFGTCSGIPKVASSRHTVNSFLRRVAGR